MHLPYTGQIFLNRKFAKTIHFANKLVKKLCKQQRFKNEQATVMLANRSIIYRTSCSELADAIEDFCEGYPNYSQGLFRKNYLQIVFERYK